MAGDSRVSRRFVLAGALAGAAAPVLAQAPATSPRPPSRPGLAAPAAPGRAAAAPEAVQLIDAARLGGRVTYAVFDRATGALLEGRAETVPQPPASVAKAVTAIYALDRLGTAHRFVTRILATGPVQGGRVQGDLVLAGGGDPTLDTDGLGDLVASLRARGLRGITGRFLVHGGALPAIGRIDAGQPEHVGYNPAISGLNLNFNRVHFEWKRGAGGWQTGMDARGERFAPAVRLARARIVERDAPLFTYSRDGAEERWTVASGALGKGGSRWLPVRQPDRYAGEVFQTLCAAQGITLPPPEPVAALPTGSVLAQAASQPLPELVRGMLRHSTNITAECLGLAASGATGLAASGARMSDWLKASHGVEGRFVDHSGLGGESRISAAEMALALHRNAWLADLMRPFGTGEKGRAAGPAVRAKTGTLNFVSGLGGFIDGPRPMVFAIFAADLPRRDGLTGIERERPTGGPQWTRRARALQGQLINRWVATYG